MGMYVKTEKGVLKVSPVIIKEIQGDVPEFQEYDLPEEFARSTKIYNQILPNNNVLISGTDTGIWLFNIITNTFIQLFADKGTWDSYFIFNTDCFITSTVTGSEGILLYDNDDVSITRKYSNTTNWRHFIKLNDDEVLFGNATSSGSTGILYYDRLTKTIVQKYASGYGWRYTREVLNGYLIIGGSTGVLFFNKTTKVCTALYISGMWTVFQDMENGNCLIGSTINTAYGILRYNVSNNTIAQLYTANYGWSKFASVSDGFLIWSDTSSNRNGVLLYKISTDTINQIYTTGYQLKSFSIDEGCFIFGGWEFNGGVYFYDNITGEFTQKYISTNRLDTFIPITRGYLITSSYGNAGGEVGILRYDNVTKLITKVYTLGQNITFAYKVDENENYLLSVNSTNGVTGGILLYNDNTKQFTRLSTMGASWNVYSSVPGGYLIGASGPGVGILYYDLSAKTISTVYSIMTDWRYFYPVVDGYIISSAAKDSGLLKYDFDTKQFIKLTADGDNYYPRDNFFISDAAIYNYAANKVEMILIGKLAKDFVISEYAVLQVSTGNIKIFKAKYENIITDNFIYGFNLMKLLVGKI